MLYNLFLRMIIKQDKLSQATDILKKNQFSTTSPDGKQYRGISPSSEYYYHAWFWDTIFHAMALVHTSPELALENIKFLTDSQWDNGHIGHIIYRFEDMPYFPGKTIWKTEGKSKSGITSSGIIQPPIIAIGVRYIYEQLHDPVYRKQVISTLLPAVEKYHAYLKNTHDPENSGLISIFHPWSSGSDNAIIFDRPMKSIVLSDIPKSVHETVLKKRVDNKVGDRQTRPLQEDYYRFLYLVDIGNKMGWNYEKIHNNFPFAVKDVSVNAMWCYANEELGRLLVSIGREKDTQRYLNWARETRNALQDSWDREKGGFTNINVTSGEWTREYSESFANFMPLLTGEITPIQFDIICDKLEDVNQYWTLYPVPSVPINHPFFELKRYWRGPTWPVINYFIIVGLQRILDNSSNRYTQEQKERISRIRKALITKTKQMIEKNGFYENYSPLKPLDGKIGNGFGNFSWTAAIYILLNSLL